MTLGFTVVYRDTDGAHRTDSLPTVSAYLDRITELEAAGYAVLTGED